MMEERMYVGIDVAKESFDLCILDSSGEPIAKRRKVPSSSKGFKELMDILHSTGDIARIRTGMESTGIYHLSLLSKIWYYPSITEENCIYPFGIQEPWQRTGNLVEHWPLHFQRS